MKEEGFPTTRRTFENKKKENGEVAKPRCVQLTACVQKLTRSEDARIFPSSVHVENGRTSVPRCGDAASREMPIADADAPGDDSGFARRLVIVPRSLFLSFGFFSFLFRMMCQGVVRKTLDKPCRGPAHPVRVFGGDACFACGLRLRLVFFICSPFFYCGRSVTRRALVAWLGVTGSFLLSFFLEKGASPADTTATYDSSLVRCLSLMFFFFSFCFCFLFLFF